MKKLVMAMGLGLGFSLPVTHAIADNHLFPADVLDKGEVDTRFNVTHDTNSVNVQSNGIPGKSILDLTREHVQMRYGLGNDLHVGAAFGYVSSYTSETTYPHAKYTSHSAEGGTNPEMWLTYGVVRDKANPFSLNAEIIASPKVTNQPSSYTARMTGAWRDSETLRFYGIVAFTGHCDSRAADATALTVGAYKDISPDLTFIAHASTTSFKATSIMERSRQHGFGVSLAAQIQKNFYLVPDISFYGDSANSNRLGNFHYDSFNNGRVAAITAYYLY